MSVLAAGLSGLAQQTTDPELLERYSPGMVGTVVVVLLAVALVLLLRSMRKQFGKVDFDEDAQDDAGRAAGRRRPPAPGDD